MKKDHHHTMYTELFATLANIHDADTMARFMKDLCTPQEIKAIAERWHVCQILNQGDLSYREINAKTGVSLATITRVARFLKDEQNFGYKNVLEKQNAR